MQRALALAARGAGRTSPNPMVGCVVARGEEVLAEGYHEVVGGPHAEVNALGQLEGRALNGATLYLNLEPCVHQGRTPPCIDLVLARKPSRVVVAMEDPNPLVKGQGIVALREAGIAVEVGLLEAEARRLNEAFIKFMRTRTPFVIAKCAMTLDGKIATRSGHSRWVTGEEARRRVHEMRNVADAVLVGSRTLMLDDPSLTTRLDREGTRDPVRIILDAAAYLSPDRKVFSLHSNAPTWIAVTEARTYPCAQEVLRISKGAGGVDMPELMAELGRREITSLIIEGGGTTLASAFESGVVDKACFFIAPKIVGGRDAITPVEGFGVATMDEALLLDEVTTEFVGQDVLVQGYPRK